MASRRLTVAVGIMGLFLAIPASTVNNAAPAWATVSGQNGRIAYVTGIDGDPEIYTANPDGSDPVNLTNTHEINGVLIDDTGPAWSPNGRMIAFTRSSMDTDADEPVVAGGVWLMFADGSNQTEIVPDAQQPAWSPDGTSIAFSMSSVGVENGLPTSVIATIDLTVVDAPIRILTDPGTWTDMGGDGTSLDRGPVWSPDGTEIFFVRSRMPATPLSYSSNVMAVTVTSKATRVVGDSTRYIDHLDVSPDGGSLVSIDMWLPNPPRSLVIRDIATGVSTTIQSDYFVSSGSAFAPSGDRLAVAITDEPMAGPSFVWTMDLDGTDRVKVVKGWDPDWQPVNPYPFGLVDPDQGQWHLRYPDAHVESFFYGNPGDIPFMGDWNCDGIDTPGQYRQSDGYVYLRNTNTQGIADIRFFFGNPGDMPIAGDFNGDGCDTVSVYRPSNQTFYIINELGDGDLGLGGAETSYVFGNPGDKPFVGDFNGDGIDTVGLHRESTGLVYFRNTHTQGTADNQFVYGDPGDRIVANDWNHNGTDTPGLFRPSRTTVYLRFTNTHGNADAWFMMGDPDWLPVAGTFE